MTQKKEIIKKGNWYLPNSLIQVEGTLNFSNEEGATLETFGGLIPLFIQSGEKNIDIILGKTFEGEDITLFDCFRTSHTDFSITGKSSAKYYSNYVFIGRHYSTAEISFDNIEVQIPNLINWLGISGFENFQNDWSRGIDLKYRKPDNLYFAIDDTNSMVFAFTQNYSWSGRFDFTIKQEATLVFTSKTSIEFQEWLRRIYTFTYFLSFCYFKFTAPISFRSLLETNDVTINSHVYILFRTTLNAVELSEDIPRMFIGFNDIKSSFEKIISNLYTKSISLEPVLFILGTSYKKASIVPELYFITMMQALETYHRRFIGGNMRLDEEWEQIKKEILETIPEKHIKLVTESLQYKNELSLRNRLKDLLTIIPESIQTRLLIKNKSGFIKLLVDLRNYYTHYDINNVPDSLNNETLIDLTYKIRIILGFSLLYELGLDKDSVTNIFMNSKDKLFFTK